jgi:hypothetical protein
MGKGALFFTFALAMIVGAIFVLFACSSNSKMSSGAPATVNVMVSDPDHMLRATGTFQSHLCDHHRRSDQRQF